MWIWLIKLCKLIGLLGNMSCQEYIHILWTQMRRTSILWLFLQFSRLTPGPRHWGNVGEHDNGALCRIPLILWRRHSCRINTQQCIPEFLSTPLLPSETQDEIFPGPLDMLIHIVFILYLWIGGFCPEYSKDIWVICYCWGNSSIVEGRFSKWF